MGVFDKFERGLERAVKAPFAKVFKAEVQPVEIASAVRGAMDERAAVLGPGRTMVPNVYTIELASTDFERLASFDTALTDELVAAAEDHADAQRYTPAGIVEVRLTSDEELETGIFRVRPASRGRGKSSAQNPAAPSGMAPARPERPAPHPSRAADPAADYDPEEFRPLPAAERPASQRPAPQRLSPQRQEQQRPDGPPIRPATINSGRAPAGLGGAGAIAAAAQRAGAPVGPGTPLHAEPEQPPGHDAHHDAPAAPPHQAPPQQAPPQQAPATPHTDGPSTRELPAANTDRRSTGNPGVRGPRPFLEIDGAEVPLVKAVTTVGRDQSADITLDDPGASRRHAELRISHDGPHLQVVVRDLGSTNGTYLNGDQVGTEQLQEGDRLTMGRTTMTFHLEGGR